MRIFVILACLLFFSSISSAQEKSFVFSKTQHDFGEVAPAEVPFEHDFLFRNTGDARMSISFVYSDNAALSFIHTQSAIEPGEYGFVKVRLTAKHLEGIFYELVRVGMIYNGEEAEEILNIRADINDNGRQLDKRAFTDSEISTSVEVAPEEIQSLEGFKGQDKLAEKAAELAYLKKQLAMKSDLILKLSSDFKTKQQQEKEQILKLQALQKMIDDNTKESKDEAKESIQQLTLQLLNAQESDSLLRIEIDKQELALAALKAEADSAKAHAESLSEKLKLQFEAEAKAIERANQLEKDLEQKEMLEALRKARIDSLQAIIDSGLSDSTALAEINRLETLLRNKEEEQKHQAEEQKAQQERIEELKAVSAAYRSQTDSLSSFLDVRTQQNAALQEQLEGSESRIVAYESKLDSLQNIVSSDNSEQYSHMLDSLKNQLSTLEDMDRQMRQTLVDQHQDLVQLKTEKRKAETKLLDLENAAALVQKENDSLETSLENLRTIAAQRQQKMESIQGQLFISRTKEDSARNAVSQLALELSSREADMQGLKTQLQQMEDEIAENNQKQAALQKQLELASAQSSTNGKLRDSLEAVIASTLRSTDALSNQIKSLQNQIIQSHNEKAEYAALSEALEAKLQHTELSGSLAFGEVGDMLEALRKERDEYKWRYEQEKSENALLNSQNEKLARQNRSAVAFLNEVKAEIPQMEAVVFRVQVDDGEQQLSKKKLKPFDTIYTYEESGKTKLAIGAETSLGAAIGLKNKLVTDGFEHALVVAFRGEERISLKEAMQQLN